MLIAFEIVAVWLAAALVCMLVVAYLARRWGHDAYGWLFWAAALGPFAIIAMVGTRHHDEDVARQSGIASTATRGSGSVVVACDGSAANARAASYAATSFGDAGITLLAVQPHEAEARTPEEEASQAEVRRELTRYAREALEAAGRQANEQLVYGNAGEEILRFADRVQASAIVVGRRGAGLSRALLGSVSDHVVRNARQPVVVVT